MTDLIERIATLRQGIDLSAQLGAQSDALGALAGLVGALRQGPPQLADLTGLVGALPVPPALSGLVQLGTQLPGLIQAAPSDPAALVGPLLAPLTELAGQSLSVSIRIDVGAVLEVVQEVMRLLTGRSFAGPQPMPDGPDGGPQAFPLGTMPPIADLRAAIAEARATVAALGPRLDAPRLLAMLQQASQGRGPLHPRFLPLPILGDLLEALGTVAAWQAMPPAQLGRSLSNTLADAARLIARPRLLLVDPMLAGATAAADAGAAFAAAADALGALLPPLAARLAGGISVPTAAEATALERAAEALEPPIAALDPQRSPLTRVAELPSDLTGHLLRAQRALSGAGDGGALLERLRGWIAATPAAAASPFGPAVAEIAALDLSAIAGPIGAVRDAVEAALQQMDAAQAAVRDALAALLGPLADALEAALAAARLDEVVPALAGFADQLSAAIDGTVRPAVDGVRGAIEGAVGAVHGAVAQFDPEQLLAPLRDALDQLAALLSDPAIQDAFAQVGAALHAAADALRALDIAGAANVAIGNIGAIQTKIEAIDPATIPDAAKPVIEQGVKVVVDIDFTATVGRPLVEGLQSALEAGPGALLAAVEAGAEALRTELEQFRPSAAIGDAIGKPFEDLARALDGFRPSALLGQVQQALDALAQQAGLLDIGAVLDPLRAAHAELRALLDRIAPAALLAPVREAADRALQRLEQEAGLDRAFAGLAELATAVEAPVALIGDARDLLREAATLVASPGDATAQVGALLDLAVTRLGGADMAALAAGFAACAAAHASIQRDAIVAPLGPALRAAAASAPAALAGPGGRLARVLATLPGAALDLARDTPATRRARAAARRLAAVAAVLPAATAAWPALAQRLQVQADALEGQLADYQRLLAVEGGGAFAGLVGPAPPDAAAMQAAVRAALQEEVAAPLGVAQQALAALAPWLGGLAAGLSDLLGAIAAKLDGVLGPQGIGGAAQGLAEIGARLGHLDLSAVETPLAALHARLAGAVQALDPAPLEAPLRHAADAIAGLLRVETLLPPAAIAAADADWAEIVAAITALSPSRVIAQVLDPAYERALGAIAPVIALPGELRAIIDAAGSRLGDDTVVQLKRVEDAFKQMLLTIPQHTGVGGAALSASVSVAA